MKTMKKYFLPFIMLGILLIAVGCANSEETGNSSEGSEPKVDKSKEAQENIKTVLENMFTGPNEEQVYFAIEKCRKMQRKVQRFVTRNTSLYFLLDNAFVKR